MDPKGNSELERISSYIASFSIKNPLDDTACRESFIDAEKRLRVLLLWGSALDVLSTGKADDEKLRLRETFSDISLACFCILSSLYKPGMMMLRSAAENFVKALVLRGGYVIESKVSVYELNDELKRQFKSSPSEIRNLPSRLIAEYAILCADAHSSKVENMNLEIPFERLISFSRSKFIVSNRALIRVVNIINLLIYWTYSGSLNNLPPQQQDEVLDRLPRALKKTVAYAKAVI